MKLEFNGYTNRPDKVLCVGTGYNQCVTPLWDNFNLGVPVKCVAVHISNKEKKF